MEYPKPSKEFRQWVANCRALEDAMRVAHAGALEAIRRDLCREEAAHAKTYGFLAGAYFENRLRRLLNEPGGFDSRQVSRIEEAAEGIKGQWRAAVDEAFSMRYGVAPGKLGHSLPRTAGHRRADILNLLQGELEPLVELRNVLGHGQWMYSVGHGAEANTVRTRSVRTVNIYDLQIRRNLIDHLVRLIHDLVVTNDAFERDFDRNWENLQHAQRRLQARGYRAWRTGLRQRFERNKPLRHAVSRGANDASSSRTCRHA